jgi:hypothetical protein
LIKFELSKDPRFSSDIECHMKEINNYLSKVYFRYDDLQKKLKSKGMDLKLDEKLRALQNSDFSNMLEIPQNMKHHPIWKRAIHELENFKMKANPQGKLESIVK